MIWAIACNIKPYVASKQVFRTINVFRIFAAVAIQPHVPLNMSERQGNIINALEHAHIYIAQQQQIIEQMLVRLAALEQQ